MKAFACILFTTSDHDCTTNITSNMSIPNISKPTATPDDAFWLRKSHHRQHLIVSNSSCPQVVSCFYTVGPDARSQSQLSTDTTRRPLLTQSKHLSPMPMSKIHGDDMKTTQTCSNFYLPVNTMRIMKSFGQVRLCNTVWISFLKISANHSPNNVDVLYNVGV